VPATGLNGEEPRWLSALFYGPQPPARCRTEIVGLRLITRARHLLDIHPPTFAPPQILEYFIIHSADGTGEVRIFRTRIAKAENNFRVIKHWTFPRSRRVLDHH
jgi:hypothetical protein